MAEANLEAQRQLLRRLVEGGGLGCPAATVELIETHVSWVLLAGDYAYKFKKAVNLGFLDYATLATRQRQCAEELRLNRRTAPGLYLEVVGVGGDLQAPTLGGEPVREYAVKMRRFEQTALLSRRLTAGQLGRTEILALGDAVARFHGAVALAPPESPFGTPEAAWEPVAQNFLQLRERVVGLAALARVAAVEAWAGEFHAAHRAVFSARKAAGFVRECHGDLHLNNIVDLDGEPVPFDCIEFNPNLRFVDVQSELAFLLMDLEVYGRPDLAWALVNRYLERSGDYAGLALLRFYQSYRAMVRAKVAAIRLDQGGLGPSLEAAERAELDRYLELALGYTAPGRPRLLITHGPSGCGKTTLTQPLIETLGAIRLRSDVERKRLFGLTAEAVSGSDVAGGIYTAAASARTYARLAELAGAVLAAGLPVVVDATFLDAAERARFAALAGRRGVPFHILAFEAPAETLRARVAAREGDASEADLTVLEHQLAGYRPPAADEPVIAIDTGAEFDAQALIARLEN